MEKRHLAHFSAFTMNYESASGPIDIIEFKSFYFPGPQSEARQQ